ncbi:MAG: iron chelate uptake ABC transporter family permease subunit [Firmicutes bacterium]|nr:iron chelate uptake ABC transporter family permease subunit [Bacillota bacterium]
MARTVPRRPLLLALAGALLASLALGVAAGSVRFTLPELWRLLAEGPAAGGADAAILWQIRIPRVALAALVGLSLGAAGAILQGLFRNPMADPYVIGVSSGAALGAVLALTGVIAGGAGAAAGAGASGGAGAAAWAVSLAHLVPAAAFAGAVGALAVVYLLARVDGQVPVTYLLLAGVAVSAFVSSLVSLVVYFHPDRLKPVYFWLLGGLSGADWAQVALVTPYVALGLLAAGALVRPLNVLLSGEETSHHLGLNVEREKLYALAVGALLAAAAVSVSGMIGFVGLVAPHVVRLLGGPDHRVVVPGAALLGAAFLVLADTVARTAIAPLELPVGVVTSLVGGPFFLYLLRTRKQAGYLD